MDQCYHQKCPTFDYQKSEICNILTWQISSDFTVTFPIDRNEPTFSKTLFRFFYLYHLVRPLGPGMSDKGVLTNSCAQLAEKLSCGLWGILQLNPDDSVINSSGQWALVKFKTLECSYFFKPLSFFPTPLKDAIILPVVYF